MIETLVVSSSPILLKEIQVRLGVPQHVLIHLCEKGVVEPDLAETSGRGKRREFSQRNLFEFAVALALRESQLPVATTALIVRVLRSFSRTLSSQVRGFEMPTSLKESDVKLVLYLDDGNHLILAGESPMFGDALLFSAKVPGTKSSDSAPRVKKLSQLPTDYDTRLEVNLTRIAGRVCQ